MSVKWIPTSGEVYGVLRADHREHMQVHGTITDLGEFSASKHIMTEWGLPGADYPLIKFDERNGVVTYWIAVITKDEE